MEAGREGGRQTGRQSGRQGGRQAGRRAEGWRQAGREGAGRQAGRRAEGWRQAGKQAGSRQQQHATTKPVRCRILYSLIVSIGQKQWHLVVHGFYLLKL